MFIQSRGTAGTVDHPDAVAFLAGDAYRLCAIALCSLDPVLAGAHAANGHFKAWPDKARWRKGSSILDLSPRGKARCSAIARSFPENCASERCSIPRISGNLVDAGQRERT